MISHMGSRKALATLLSLILILGPMQTASQGSPEPAENPSQEEDQCAREVLTDYNLGLHIGSIFILLAVSLFGSCLPVILRITSKHTITQTIIKLGTFFGFGTILSTAFIHMLQPAAQNLSSECLPDLWTEKYEAWAYLFVVIAILMMQLIDYLVEMAYTHFMKRSVDLHGDNLHGAIIRLHGGHDNKDEGPQMQRTASTNSNTMNADGDNSETASQDEEAGACAVHGAGCHTLLKESHQEVDVTQVVGIYLMEAGIVFHSVLIGLTLGVTTGSAFVILLIAIIFHQTFEGFAIGSAAVNSGITINKAFLLGVIFSVTTPIGIAIGIGLRESFNQNAQRTLLVEGIMDSFSSGILIYVVMVELINPMMTQSPWLREQRWWLQMLSFVALYGGAGVMALIGKWA